MSDALLQKFRKAAEIEFRLIEIETWLTANFPSDPKEQVRRWRLCSVRVLTLAVNDRRLRPFVQDCLKYLRDVHDRQLLAVNSSGAIL